MLKGKTLLIASLGLGSALAAVGVFVFVRAYFGSTPGAVMAGGFVALVGPILAVIVLLPKLTDDVRKEE